MFNRIYHLAKYIIFIFHLEVAFSNIQECCVMVMHLNDGNGPSTDNCFVTQDEVFWMWKIIYTPYCSQIRRLCQSMASGFYMHCK